MCLQCLCTEKDFLVYMTWTHTFAWHDMVLNWVFAMRAETGEYKEHDDAIFVGSDMF